MRTIWDERRNRKLIQVQKIPKIAEDTQYLSPASHGKPPFRLLIVFLVTWYGWSLTWSQGYLFSWFTKSLAPNAFNLSGFCKMLWSLNLGVLLAIAKYSIPAAAIFLSALSIGRLIIDKIGIPDEMEIRNLVALGVGLGSLSHTLLTLGLFGLWNPPAILLTLGLPLFAGGLHYKSELHSWLQSFPTGKILRSLANPGWWLLSAYIILNLLAVLGPEFYYDSLVYHLALPRLYLLNHRIIPTPHMIYSGIPFGTEMLYGACLVLGDESLAKFIHFSFGLFICSIIYRWSKPRLGGEAALLAILIFYCARMVTFESWIAKVELPWTFYTLLSALSLAAAICQKEQKSRNVVLIVAGLLSGFAISTKYNAMLYTAALTLTVVITGRGRENVGSRIRDAVLFLGMAGLAASPWFAKNIFFYENPVYPFFPELFGATTADVTGLMQDAGLRGLETFTSWVGIQNLFSGLVSPSWPLDNYIGVGTILAIPWMLVLQKGAEQISLRLMLVAIFIMWAAHTRMPRFLMPALPLLSILAAGGICHPELQRRFRLGLITMFYCILFLNLGGAFLPWYRQGLWKVVLGISSKEEYLSHSHPSYTLPYFAGIRFINSNLATNSTVLFLGEERAYYCERKFIAASVFDVNPIHAALKNSKDAREIRESLKAMGITHLLVNRASRRYYDFIERMPADVRYRYQTLLQSESRLLFEEKRTASNDPTWIQVFSL